MIAALPTDEITPPPRADATLGELLSTRARQATARRLTIDIVAGLLAAGALWWQRPPAWTMLLPVAICLAAYGCWAFADRAVPRSLLVVPQRMHTLWRILRAVAGLIGILSFATALVVFLGVALGRLQS